MRTYGLPVLCLVLLPVLIGCQSFAWRDRPEDGRLELLEGDRPVLTYCYGDQLASGVPAKFRRASYIHPIHGLDGELLTEDFPKDHRHHRGLSLMWPVMKVGDQSCDLWTLENIRSVFKVKLYQTASDSRASLGVRNAWVMNGREVADEVLQLTVWPATGTGQFLDVWYVLTAGAEPITLRGQTIQDKGYGGLIFRTPHESRRRDTVITTDAGPQRKDSLRRPFRWADLTARFPGGAGRSGIAVIPSGGHPGFPPGWMLRHYGVLNPAWPGAAEFVLQPGVPLELSYRIFVHRGSAAAADVAGVAAAWQRER